MPLTELAAALRKCLQDLQEQDGCLFGLSGDAPLGTPRRKLYEVCINHRLANHIERYVVRGYLEAARPEKLFVDIEFNREGENAKALPIGTAYRTIRPDIIVHNRLSGGAKFNYLVVECKKGGASDRALKTDLRKLKELMSDAAYAYSFGLQVIYDRSRTEASLLYRRAKHATIETLGISS